MVEAVGDQVVVVVGASSGIGRAAALAFARKGAAVVCAARGVQALGTVVEEIVSTAEHPRREVAVGGSAIGFVTGQRLSPALSDGLLSLPRLGVSELEADRPDNGVDDVDAPVDEPGRVHGSHPGTVLRHSPVTAVLARVPRPGDVLTGALSTLRRAAGRGTGGRRAGPGAHLRRLNPLRSGALPPWSPWAAPVAAGPLRGDEGSAVGRRRRVRSGRMVP